MTRLRWTALAAAGAVVALSGCQFTGLEGVTLPGGKAAGGAVNDYTIRFHDVLDLVPQSGVHYNDVNVGEVKSISLDHDTNPLDGCDGSCAKVTIRVVKSLKIPTNAVAVVRQTALLGEKYVSIEVPDGQAPAASYYPDPASANGNTIKSGANEEVQVEDVFGALSALLNGGGVEQLQTISVELSQALTGRESSIKDLLSQLTTLTGSLDTHRTEIVRALDSLDRLSTTLVAQRQTIATALQQIAPGLKVLADERQDLVKLLTGLDNLSTVATRVIHENTTQTVEDLRLLQPTLDRLTQSGTEIASSLQLLASYPFGDAVFNAVPGDFTGLRVTLNLDLRPNSPNNPLSPNGPLCGSLPVTIPITVPKPPFCNSTAAADKAASTPQTVVGAINAGALAGATSSTAPAAGSSTAPTQPSLSKLLSGIGVLVKGVFQ